MSPDAARRHRGRVIAAFATVYLVWGSTYLGIAFAIASIPPLLMVAGRFLIAGLVLYAWGRLTGAPRPRPRQWGWALLLGGLFFLVGNGAVAWVEQYLPSGLVALIIALVSVWTALLEWFRPGGERPPRLVLAGIVLGFLGVALLVVPGRMGGRSVEPAGVLLLVASTFAWALASVLSRTADLPKSTAMASGMEMLCGGVLLLLAGLAAGEGPRFDPAAVTLKSLLAFVYLLLIGSLLTFTCYAWLLRVSTPNKVSTAGFVNPMVAVFLGWAFGGEGFTLRSLLASLVIVAAVALIITGRELGASRVPPIPGRGLDPLLGGKES